MESGTMAAVRRILAENPKRTLGDPTLAPAGVMLLLYPKDGEYAILLNKRSDTVDDHKGEVSFPGGRRDGADRTLLDTALRETHEEVGIRPDDVDVLGELDEVATNSSYAIGTFVGTIPEGYRFVPSQAEVAEIIELPGGPLISGALDRNETRLIDGKPVRWPCYAYDGHVIFGATARLLARFVELMSQASGEELTWKTQPG
jgi:8-oxo-dGTP pyrophosphatase MutT (NUDIX family)